MFQSYRELPGFAGFADNFKTRMDTEQFAELMVVGLANELEEVWITGYPQILFTYLSEHIPGILKWYVP